uniref:WAP domain-containing protein n=1 Tax=Sinocyclocheilus grahami TaxID=75366 RepID=A0A672KA06_SINGR
LNLLVSCNCEETTKKPGVCPKNPEVALLGGCVERCSHDSDCPKDEKCCSKGCGQQCMPPYKVFLERQICISE